MHFPILSCNVVYPLFVNLVFCMKLFPPYPHIYTRLSLIIIYMVLFCIVFSCVHYIFISRWFVPRRRRQASAACWLRLAGLRLLAKWHRTTPTGVSTTGATNLLAPIVPTSCLLLTCIVCSWIVLFGVFVLLFLGFSGVSIQSIRQRHQLKMLVRSVAIV